MKASELVEKLKWRIEEYGDCEVKISNWNEVKQFLAYAGYIPEDRIKNVSDVSVEASRGTDDVIVIWDI